MKWQPFGKKSCLVIDAYRKGCAGGSCVHLEANNAMIPDEARKVAHILWKAAHYADGKNDGGKK